MFKTPALVLASFLMLASPALAQRSAPITQGTTSSDLAQQVAQARQQNADLTVQISGLKGDIMELNGRIETLEFQLQQSRNDNEALVKDNETLADDMKSLRSEMRAQSRALQDLQARVLGMDPGEESTSSSLSSEPSNYSSYPGSASGNPYPSSSSASGGTTTRTVTTITRPVTSQDSSSGGPRRIVGSEPSSGVVTRSAESVRDQSESAGMAVSQSNLPTGSLGTIPASALPGEAGPLFASAKAKLIQFDYAGAEVAFRAFIDQFSDDPQAGEAHYWLAEALYQQKAYADSGAAYTTMIRSYPDDPRAPDALVKLARAMRLIGDKEKACLALDTLPKRYPKASGVTRDLAAVERTKSGCSN
ncbi:MAG: tol-pal system protein YbgF [Hyphomonas sp.]|uniref:tol-pal system protein YbgF n=1 Tax=Hyphomonas sp. TaxID=87 RepID=UPI0035270CC3